MPRPDADLERELNDLGWLRRLARSLVRDDAAADDVVQETAAAALRAGPDRPRSVRSWLAAVARNAARRSHRDARRRAAREAAVARPEASPGASETSERLDSARALLAAVEALEEPYRTAVRLRWLDGLPPREVAARLGVSPEVAWKRLSRGLAMLRARLDRDRGGRRGWVLAMADLGGLSDHDAPIAPLAAAAVLACWTWKSAAALILAAVCALIATASTREGRAPESPWRPPARDHATVPAPTPQSAAGEGARRVARPRARTSAAVEPAAPTVVPAHDGRESTSVDAAPSPPADRIVGRVLDPDGAPVADATIERRIRRDLRGHVVRSGSDGRFALPQRAEGSKGGEVLVTSSAWAPATVALAGTGGGVTDVGDIRVAARRPIAGHVVTTEGVPAAGARVVLGTPAGGHTVTEVTVSARDGAFRLEDAGPGPWLVTVRAPDDETRGGWVGGDLTREVAGGDVGVTFVARVRPPGTARVVLDVVDSDGAPVRGLSSRSVRAVAISAASFEEGRDVAGVTVGGDGPEGVLQVSLERVRPGDWLVALRAADLGPVATRVHVDPADTIVRSRVVLTRAGGVRVRAVFDGPPPTGPAFVLVGDHGLALWNGSWRSRLVRTGAIAERGDDGVWTADGIAPGRYALTLLCRDARADPLEVEVPAGGVADAEITVRRAAAVAWTPIVPVGHEAEIAFAVGDGEFRVVTEFEGTGAQRIFDRTSFPAGRLRWRIRVAPTGWLASEGRRVATYLGEVEVDERRGAVIPDGPFEGPR